MRAPVVLTLLISFAAVSPLPAWRQSSKLEAVPAPVRHRVAMLPFTPRGTATTAWPLIRDAMTAQLGLGGFDPVDEAAVESFLRDRRLRDMSLLTRDELNALADAVGADLVLLGDIYRCEETPAPTVSLSGRLIDPSRDDIDAISCIVLEGRSLQGPMGTGGPVTLDRVIGEATRQLVAGLAASRTGAMERDRPRLLRGSVLAPEPVSYMSPRLAGMRIARIAVLPFRYQGRRGGAGQAAADVVSWCLLASGRVSLIEPGGALRRLLERGWRTGQAVGRDELLALHQDLGVDAVLMGTIDRWDEGDASGTQPPLIGMSARLLDATTGEILWTAAHERRGDQTRTIYDLGNVHLTEELLARSAAEMLAPLVANLHETSSLTTTSGEPIP